MAARLALFNDKTGQVAKEDTSVKMIVINPETGEVKPEYPYVLMVQLQGVMVFNGEKSGVKKDETEKQQQEGAENE